MADPTPACQVVDVLIELPCNTEESGGYRCEVFGPHEQHRIGEHTVQHALAGNGYTCGAIDAWIAQRDAADKAGEPR